MEEDKRTLILSYSGLLKYIAHELDDKFYKKRYQRYQIDETQMIESVIGKYTSALFYFGCTKEHVNSPLKENIDLEHLGEKYDEEIVLNTKYIMDQILEKTDSNSFMWRKLNGSNSIYNLNELLINNGIEENLIPFLHYPHYSYPAVERYYSHLFDVKWRGPICDKEMLMNTQK